MRVAAVPPVKCTTPDWQVNAANPHNGSLKKADKNPLLLQILCATPDKQSPL
jgi:hypothetical protein